MIEEQKTDQAPKNVATKNVAPKTETPIDMPEGKMEISLRVLSNELIGIKMSVDDMKMKWVIIGVGAIGVLLWAAAAFGPALTSSFSGG